eukprot:gene19820-26505_t
MQLVVHLLALLALVSASQVDPIHASQRLYTYKTELPPELLNQAIGMQGDRSRLEKTITKLIKGDAVKIALLGGSLSIRGWNFYDESYIRQVHKCMLQKTPEDVDLVMVDFGVNDYQASNFFSHPERHAYERILRHFLAIEHSPSVLLFEAYAWSESGGFFLGSEHRRPLGQTSIAVSLSNYGNVHLLSATSGTVPEVHLAQGKHSIIAEYYGNVQLLSARAALNQMMNASAPKGSDIHAFDKRLIYMGHFRDQMHVSLTGHRWYADMIINYIRQVATEVIIKMIVAQVAIDVIMKMIVAQTLPKEVVDLVPGMASVALSTLPPATTSSCEVKGVCALGRDFIRTVVKQDGWEWLDEGHTGAHKCLCPGLDFIRTRSQPYGWVAQRRPDRRSQGVCALGRDFIRTVVKQDGWEWLDEGHTGVHKWGYVSTTVGSKLIIGLELGYDEKQLDLSNPYAPQNRVTGFLIFLVSYEGMGTAELSCIGGYTNVTNADGTFSLTLSTEAADQKCEVQIEILSNTTAPDKGHKFKVIGITTSTSSIWHLDDIVKRDNEHWVDV